MLALSTENDHNPDLRHRWPEAEAALQGENEILITRGSKPVAKLVRVAAGPKRSRWNAEEHAQRRGAGGGPRRPRVHDGAQMIYLDTVAC
jgi:antitoxin (DNA-binding transcriptional repressor) of toxin-antitoxin stability system